jgi:trans-aconitate 2-methyltransferase
MPSDAELTSPHAAAGFLPRPSQEEAAAQRREQVHRIFAATSAALLREQVAQPPRLAVDLGCGPGHSTVLLQKITEARLVMGLDTSTAYIQRAQGFSSDRRRFNVHDVQEIPFPVGPADLLYARLLISYLSDPMRVLDRWATQLALGGLLIVEELDAVESAYAPFRDYLDLVARAVAEAGTALYPGPLLDSLRPGPLLQRLVSTVRELPVENAEAAAMFGGNLTVWREHPFVQKHYTNAMLDELEDSLASLVTDASPSRKSGWRIRQLVFQRVAAAS